MNPDCDHNFEPFLADGRVPYRFCRKCKATLLHGVVHGLKPWPVHGKAGPSDGEMLDWLETQGTPGMPWVARQSMSGRGYRLHQAPSKWDAGAWPVAGTARGAIKKAMVRG